MAFRILPHTADVGIEVTAPDVPALFSEAVRATAAVILDRDPPTGTAEAPVAAEAGDLAALLADVLSEGLWIFESTWRLPVSAALEVSATTAAGAFSVADAERPDGPAIKAVTYHQLVVERAGEGWRARVYFDV